MPLKAEYKIPGHEIPEHEIQEHLPAAASSQQLLNTFLHRVSTAPQSALLLDFDGTLAPFRVDPASVHPWAGVRQLLDGICAQHRTRVAIVSGRPARQVTRQLGLQTPIEICGLHGAERLLPSGEIENEVLHQRQVDALRAARQLVQQAGMPLRLEEKWNAVVVHWRGKSPAVAEATRMRMLEIFSPFSEIAGMSLLMFDGGVELRAGRNKGGAVRLLLRSLPLHAPVAYLGDDITDEDAFEALGARGLSILVRRAPRPTAAQLWLRPPAELRAFLKSWLRAIATPPVR
jgi:trehalose-phosphatase